VAGLQSALHIKHFLEIKESFRNPATTPERAPTDAYPVNKKVSHCFVHKGKELELHCETCGELICTWCALKGGKHQNHDYEELTKAFQKYKEEITSSLDPMEGQVTAIKSALTQFDICCREISNQQKATKHEIHSTFRSLRGILDARETELVSQLDEHTQVKLKHLAAQRNEIETALAQLNSCLHFMRESLRAKLRMREMC
jgi:DNA-binding FrmR family transcriptional regulator